MLYNQTLIYLGVEVRYSVYNPLIQKIEVLKLEKRLDEHLLYLRDAPPEYSTVPVDMEMIPHLPNTPVPLNTIKVKKNARKDVFFFWNLRRFCVKVPLREPPWTKYWERHPELKGIADFWHFIPDRRKHLYRRVRFPNCRSVGRIFDQIVF